jgi:hypothetical protein
MPFDRIHSHAPKSLLLLLLLLLPFSADEGELARDSSRRQGGDLGDEVAAGIDNYDRRCINPRSRLKNKDEK